MSGRFNNAIVDGIECKGIQVFRKPISDYMIKNVEFI